MKTVLCAIGYRVLHIFSGIKDIDCAVKEVWLLLVSNVLRKLICWKEIFLRRLPLYITDFLYIFVIFDNFLYNLYNPEQYFDRFNYVSCLWKTLTNVFWGSLLFQLVL